MSYSVFPRDSNGSQSRHQLGMKRPPGQLPFGPSRPKKTVIEVPRPENTVANQRRALPIFSIRNRLLKELEKRPTAIIIGETGCGKTTQIPQYLHELQMEGNWMIGITQPRRVAAITISARVALEMRCELGSLVGYTVRFEDLTSASTKLKYLTDGMLLREAMLDDCLKEYNIIILDEAHERTIHTDVLFGIVKQAQKKRITNKLKPLKVIIMSATMDVDHFSKYFNNAETIYIEGRQYPVTVYHTAKPVNDYISACMNTIYQIHKEAPPNHDILVFLTGQEEIEVMAANLRAFFATQIVMEKKLPPLKIVVLYAALVSSKQLEAFQPSPPGSRKVIISTNIAETSVTISGIKYVIDSGVVKLRQYHSKTGLEMLRVQPISQAQAWQRAGRAGRESEGFCYRVFTKSKFDSLPKNTTPEIQRSNLSSVILQLLALKINALNFDFMDKPPVDYLVSGLELLKQLGAIEKTSEEPRLNQLGRQMAMFPLDPHMSKVLLSADQFKCVEEILSIIAVLSSESIFVNNYTKPQAMEEARAKFMSSAGDHITLLNIFRAFNNCSNKKVWCYENFLNCRNLEHALKVRKQLADICARSNMPMSTCGKDTVQVRKCLITGYFMNIAELQSDKKYITVSSKKTAVFHPKSALSGSLPPLVLFTELVQPNTGASHMKCVSPIDPEWVEDIAPKHLKISPFL